MIVNFVRQGCFWGESHAVWDMAEANSSKDLEEGNGLWAEAIWNLRKARDQVACRHNASRKVKIFRVGRGCISDEGA
jgi:hypothetical protein